MGDVIRDLPAALAGLGWQATVLTPSYGTLHKRPEAVTCHPVEVAFRNAIETIEVFDIAGGESQVRNIVFEHPGFSPLGPGRIYCNDEPARPFATDASKFALFCAAAAAWILKLARMPDVVHLQDWHAGPYAVLRAYHPDYQRLRDIRTVFTIHNVSYQGTRPISGDESALATWFPQLEFEHAAIGDPVHSGCFNPLAAAIRLADRIGTVSPTYAREICEPGDDERGFIGGEGLEKELARCSEEGRLSGILNGCNYGRPLGRRPGWQRILKLAAEQVSRWNDETPASRSHAVAAARLDSLPQRKPKHLLTSVGRLVSQKVSLLFEPLPDGRTALDAILGDLGSQGVLIVLGSGEPHYEQKLLEIAERARNLLFLRGYSETLADPLYRGGDLFLMPSSFEPCGISQMLAMRSAQPCVVHGVGGLKDTVSDGRSGFVFGGATRQWQASNFVATVRRALEIKTGDPDEWQNICIRAASMRYRWAKSAEQTIEKLYGSA